MKKVLVCGSTGFIGRNIVEILIRDDGYDVYGTYYKSPPLDYTGLTSVEADLTRDEDVRRVVKGMDIIIQAAATTSGAGDIVTRPYIHTADNAVMNSHIFRAAHEYSVKHVVFFSCTVMYPSSPVPLKETDFDFTQEITPQYFGVAWTKLYIEKMCEFYSGIGDTKYTTIRHSNIYGPYDKFDLERSHVFGATMTKVMTNTNGKLVIWGPGTEERDLLHVDDLVSFVVKAVSLQRSAFELVNVGLGSAISIRDLVGNVIKASGKSIEVEHDVSRPHIPTKLCLDTSRAKKIFDWEPTIDLDEGIEKTMEWYRRNIGEAG